MKKLLLLLFFPLIGFCQISNLKLTIDGFEPIVIEVKDKSAKELYDSAYEWILRNYNTPEIVIKAKIENEMIRIEGFQKDTHRYTLTGVDFSYNTKYSLTLSFKEGRYRFDFQILNVDLDSNKISGNGYYPRDLYKKSGERRKHRTYNDMHSSLETTVNNLSSFLYDFIINGAKDDW